jgi:hypothetical protein
MNDKKPLTEAEFLSQKGGYLALHGPRLIENGYTVVPISVGKKAPGFDGWQKARATTAQIREWVDKDGHRWAGVGVLTKNTPAIDIDVRDEEVALLVDAWVRKKFGAAPMRIGRAPKRLFVFRTDEPFRKMRSTKYQDEWCQDQMIEVLGDGQQFVAFHKHPDTNKPYTWPDKKNPLNVRAADLPTLDAGQIAELFDYFDELARERGWSEIKGKRLAGASGGDDNPWAEDSNAIDIEEDELRNYLMMVPHPEDHDEWINIGMALYHQYDGDDQGLELWNEWASEADNYDADELDRRWKSFAIRGKKRAPITARYIVKMAKEAMETAALKLGVELQERFQNAKTQKEWEEARTATREAEIDSLTRSRLSQVAKKSLDGITGAATPLSEIKKAIAFSGGADDKTPEWCTDWVYDTSNDRFFSLKRKISASKQGFDAMYDRKAFTKKDLLDGKKAASNSASELALNTFRVPVVNGLRFMPGDDDIIYTEAGTFANTYHENEIPAMPEKLSPRDRKAINRVKAHIAHLLPDEREQRMLIDWLSWVVQNPGDHVRYGVLLQGVEGDGKTFFAEMMRMVMGISNVRMLNAQIFHSDFSDWAEGQVLACVEEVRLVDDKNKHEVLNKIKPFIANTIVEIHPKGKPIHNIKAMTSYLLFTNFKDALPITDNDRRYLVLFSQWQNRERLKEFKAEHPDYYAELYGCIEESPGALRHWLINHKQADDFKPMDNAPDTKARLAMIRRAKPPFVLTLEEVIDDNGWELVSRKLVATGHLEAAFDAINVAFPSAKALGTMLDREGYEQIGRMTINGSRTYLWSKDPALFVDNDVLDPDKVLEYYEKRKDEILDADDEF